jgi:hypothetical protein
MFLEKLHCAGRIRITQVSRFDTLCTRVRPARDGDHGERQTAMSPTTTGPAE